jgi:hypothetical protein
MPLLRLVTSRIQMARLPRVLSTGCTLAVRVLYEVDDEASTVYVINTGFIS